MGGGAAISLEWLLSRWSLRSQRQQIIRKTEEKEKGMASAVVCSSIISRISQAKAKVGLWMHFRAVPALTTLTAFPGTHRISAQRLDSNCHYPKKLRRMNTLTSKSLKQMMKAELFLVRNYINRSIHNIQIAPLFRYSTRHFSFFGTWFQIAFA